MDYFIMSQDKEFINTPEIVDFYSRYQRNNFVPKNANKIPNCNVVFSSSTKAIKYIDFLSSQIFLLSDKIKEIFDMYSISIVYKIFFILNNETNQDFIYYAPILPEIKCINSKKSSLCIQKNMINYGDSIFRVTYNMQDLLIVGLDVAESLLRRNIKGVCFRRVETE